MIGDLGRPGTAPGGIAGFPVLGPRPDGASQLDRGAGDCHIDVVGLDMGVTDLSRRRESLADASGVELCRNPAGLLSALRKLQTNDTPLARTNHATAAMCIDDPLQHHRGSMHRLFDTHPPIAERIAVLERMEQGLMV